MDKLNKKQRIVVWVALIMAVGMFLYPPQLSRSYSRRGGSGYLEYTGYAPIWQAERIDFARLLIQYGLLAGLCWAAVTTLKTSGD